MEWYFFGVIGIVWVRCVRFGMEMDVDKVILVCNVVYF